ncbi:MAG: hypothetical protein SV375_17395 [Thermodesulfobacteriota bacterium]|nr:hypothetical protein [Thermodesulfobacteriota bacterium]
MPRHARIDAQGAMNLIIGRGMIAHNKLFDGNADHDFFFDRLGVILTETSTQLLCMGVRQSPTVFICF